MKKRVSDYLILPLLGSALWIVIIALCAGAVYLNRYISIESIFIASGWLFVGLSVATMVVVWIENRATK